MNQPMHNPTPLPPHGGRLEVHLLGLVDFDAWLGLQEYLTYEMSGASDCNGRLFLCEHPPLITVGREGSAQDILIDEQARKQLELPIRWVSRGGGAIAHGPGQLAIYLLIPLFRMGIGIADYRRRLEIAVCETCRELKLAARRHPAAPGIWGRSGQLGFVGAGIRSAITNHGLFLNVSLSPEFQKLTQPCSTERLPSTGSREELVELSDQLDDGRTKSASDFLQRGTSIQTERLQPVSMPRLRETLIRKLSSQFGYLESDISTGHPLLKRTLQRVPIHV